MTAQAQSDGRGFPWRIVGWGTVGFLLFLPWVANAPWTLSDYVFAAGMFALVGGGLELAFRNSVHPAYQAGAGAAILAGFLTVWANGAVGMIGSEDNPYNFLFLGVPCAALIGAILARFEAAGMTRAMIVAAAAQAAVGAGGLTADLRGGILSIAFGGLWLLSAASFWSAAQRQTAERSAR